jgi:glycosyltransferase involved in cell wall biosynthesis
MRILHVTPGYFPELGGVERHVQDVCEGLVRLGHEVAVVTMTNNALLPRHELIAGVEVHRLSAIGPQAYRLPLGLLAFLRQHHFDLVHAHNYHALPMLLTAFACGSRCVISPYLHGHAHSPTADLLHQFYRPFGQLALRQAAQIVCLSDGEADLVMRRLGIARTKIVVIPSIVPSIVDVPSDAMDRSDHERASTEQLLLCVGRLEAYKRVDRAILALAHLPENYRLAIIGDGAEKSRLERLVVAHGLTQRVQLLGRMSDAALERYYRMAHAVITCSEAESFGRVVVEALAYRCHVICSDIPAFRDLASDHPQSVTLVHSGMPDQQLAALIESIAARPTVRADVQRYSWQSVTAQLMSVYGGQTRTVEHKVRPYAS